MSTIQEDLDKRFDHHPPPRREVQDDHEAARAIIKSAALDATEIAPAGRELSLAITKLEEALFWLNAAIARGNA